MRYALKYVQNDPYPEWPKTERGYEAWHYTIGSSVSYTIDLDKAKVFPSLNEAFMAKYNQEKFGTLNRWYYTVEAIK